MPPLMHASVHSQPARDNAKELSPARFGAKGAVDGAAIIRMKPPIGSVECGQQCVTKPLQQCAMPMESMENICKRCSPDYTRHPA